MFAAAFRASGTFRVSVSVNALHKQWRNGQPPKQPGSFLRTEGLCSSRSSRSAFGVVNPCSPREDQRSKLLLRFPLFGQLFHCPRRFSTLKEFSERDVSALSFIAVRDSFRGFIVCCTTHQKRVLFVQNPNECGSLLGKLALRRSPQPRRKRHNCFLSLVYQHTRRCCSLVYLQ